MPEPHRGDIWLADLTPTLGCRNHKDGYLLDRARPGL